MRHKILFFLMALIGLPLWAADGIQQSKDASNISDKKLDFQLAPIPEALKQKIASKTLAAGGGNEFYCMLPPNDRTPGVGQGNLSIYICSDDECSPTNPVTVTVERASMPGALLKFTLDQPGISAALTASDGTGINGQVYPILQRNWELLFLRKEYSSRNVVTDKSFRITSENGDVFVYVGSFSDMTSEGYMVLPTHLLGNRYIHVSHGDNDEQDRRAEIIGDVTNSGGDFRTGFSTIAVSDNTIITAYLKSNQSYCIQYDKMPAPTVGTTTVTSPTLRRGEIWSVVNGLNTVRNQICDFSGTIVESTNPFAMVSWVQRTGIPTFSVKDYQTSGHGRDNLVEQLLPVEYWGTEFVSVQFKGGYETQSHWKAPAYPSIWDQNPGNYFRVANSQPGTTFTVEYYDLLTLKSSLKWSTTMVGVGEVASKGEGNIPPRSPVNGVSGAAIWKSDKPIQVMQYMNSQNVSYNYADIDPCMVLIPPTAQYGHNTTFKTAPYINNAKLRDHYVTLYIKGPVNADGTPNTDYNAIEECINTINVSESGNSSRQYKIANVDAGVFGNHIPGTPYYFARWGVPPDQTVYISAETPISGTVYGWGGAISYAWPTAMGLVKVGTNDLDPPIVESSFECAIASRLNANNRIDTGDVTVRSQWWDTVYIEGTDFEDAIVDEGISRRPTLTDESSNLETPRYYYYDPYVAPDASWLPNAAYKQGAVTYQTINPYNDVIAYIHYEDEAGHTAVSELLYIADKLKYYDISDLENPLTTISFGSVVTGQTATKTIVIKNINTEEYAIFPTNIQELALRYNYFTITQPSKTTLMPGDTVHITITYTPTSTDNLLDYLYINTQCLVFPITVTAGSGYPRIAVSDIDFGSVPLNQTSDATEFTVRNNGSLDLTITSAAFNPQPVAPEPDTFEFVTDLVGAPAGETYLTALPTVAAPWIIPAGGSVKARIRYHAHIPGPVSASLCFESDANPDLDANYDNCAMLNGNGIETGIRVTPAAFGRRRVCSENAIDVRITNNGNFGVTFKDIAGANGVWEPYIPGNDTLWSTNRHYFITGILALVGDTLYPHSDSLTHSVAQREFYVQVHFNPTSEYPVYGTAETEISYTVNFEPVEGINSIAGEGRASGEAYLPKLTVSDYTFPNTIKYNTQHVPPGDIVLIDSSYTSNTRIFSVRILETDQWQDFSITNAAIYIDDSPEPVPQTEGNILGTRRIEVNFKPIDANPVQRRCPVEIVSDAYTTCGEDTLRYDTIWLHGTTYDDAWEVNNPDYGTFARCDSPDRPISVLNNGTIPLVIDSVTVGTGFANVMRLNLPAGVQFPITVAAGSANEDLHFAFEGCNYIDAAGNPLEGTTSIPVTVHTNMGSQVATFSANPLYIPVELTLPTINNTAPGVRITIPVTINIANTSNAFYNFDNANIRSFTVTIDVKRAQLYFDGGFASTIDGWQFSLVQTDDNVTITGTYVGPQGTQVQAGAIVYPYAVVMVGTDGIIPMHISDITFDRTCCVRLMGTTDGEVTFDICAQVPRGDIMASGTQYALEPVAPNPFTEKTLPINYAIGLDAQTTIKIFNSNGDLVKVAVDEYQKTGLYTKDVNIGDLATGVYQINITSGPFEATEPLVIVR